MNPSDQRVSPPVYGYTGLSAISGSVPLPHTSDNMPVLPEIQRYYDGVVNSINTLRDEISILEEKLGYVSLSAPPSSVDHSKSNSPEPERSPLAHNLHCVECELNILSFRIQGMRNRLQI